MLSADPRAILPDPPDELKRHSKSLADRMRARIADAGPMPFSTFMDMALYEPGLGYYSAGLAKFGECGDFVTAPELGQVFARCLAAQVREVASQLDDWDLLEVGAGNGSLAARLLTELGPELAPRRYRILERSAHLRQVQHEQLDALPAGLSARAEWLDQPPGSDWEGLLLANEVIDALPVERFCIDDAGFGQLRVDWDGASFTWSRHPVPAALESALGAIGERLKGWPEAQRDNQAGPYRSELCPQLPAWLDGLTATLRRGAALFVDYGYPRHEYYAPQRADGTLICHYRHRGHADPFLWPGLQDISAFVDFTALAEAGDACGLRCQGYTTQAMFLLGCGLEDSMAELESLPERERLLRSREIRMLTLPDAMGEKFQCMVLSRGLDGPLRGFTNLDLRYRL